MFKLFIINVYNTFAVLAVAFFIGIVVIAAETLSYWIEYLSSISLLGLLIVAFRNATTDKSSNPGSGSGAQFINYLDSCVGQTTPCTGLQFAN